MPHERPRWQVCLPLTHRPLPAQKDAFHTKRLWVRAHAMANHSSPDWRARTGVDTQRVVYARAPLQVRRGVRTTTSMYCDTNVRKLLTRWTSNDYIRCLYPSPSCPHAPCLVHACANVLFAHVCHTCCVCIDLSPRILAYSPFGGRVHAPLSLCVHAHCYCVIYSEGVHARFSSCGCMHIFFL